jgi:hypothetical protein
MRKFNRTENFRVTHQPAVGRHGWGKMAGMVMSFLPLGGRRGEGGWARQVDPRHQGWAVTNRASQW